VAFLASELLRVFRSEKPASNASQGKSDQSHDQQTLELVAARMGCR
jgi:hypothetical protein